MNFTEALNKINEFETKENIDVFNSEYGNLWPLFRFFIIFKSRSSDSFLLPKSDMYRKMSAIKQGVFSKKKYPFSFEDTISKFSNTDELWFSRASFRKENVRNHNKYFDPFIKYLATDNALIIENDASQAPLYSFKEIGHNVPVLNLRQYHLKYNRKIAFFGLNQRYKTISKKYKLDVLAQKFSSVSSYDLFLLYVDFVRNFKFFSSILKRFPKVKRVFFDGYYSYDNLAIIAVAKNEDIESIDVQHGVQSNDHFAYGRWNYRNDYKLLPSSFYVFSSKEKNILTSSFSNVKVKIVGNLIHKDWEETQSIAIDKKNILLFTLQNVTMENDHFVYSFFQYINNTFPDIKVVLRLHPRHKYVQPEFEESLKKYNVIFEWDNSQDVFDILKKTCFHITLNSTVVEDSLLMNIPSIVLDQRGKSYYQTHIDDTDLVFFVENNDEMISIFNRLIPG